MNDGTAGGWAIDQTSPATRLLLTPRQRKMDLANKIVLVEIGELPGKKVSLGLRVHAPGCDMTHLRRVLVHSLNSLLVNPGNGWVYGVTLVGDEIIIGANEPAYLKGETMGLVRDALRPILRPLNACQQRSVFIVGRDERLALVDISRVKNSWNSLHFKFSLDVPILKRRGALDLSAYVWQTLKWCDGVGTTCWEPSSSVNHLVVGFKPGSPDLDQETSRRVIDDVIHAINLRIVDWSPGLVVAPSQKFHFSNPPAPDRREH